MSKFIKSKYFWNMKYFYMDEKLNYNNSKKILSFIVTLVALTQLKIWIIATIKENFSIDLL